MRLTEIEILEKLSGLYDGSKPLSVSITRNRKIKKLYERYDVIAELEIEGNYLGYIAVEVVSVPNPKNLLDKVFLIKQKEKDSSVPITVIIVAPYIGPKQRKILDEQDICWMDLCGNMKIKITKGKSTLIYVEKAGNRNRFPDTAPIKKIFQGTSSLVSRALLLKPEGFNSQNELADFINKRNASVTASTISRVLKRLEEELLVSSDKSKIILRDAKTIFDELLSGFKVSNFRRERRIFRFASENFEEQLYYALVPNLDCVACGFYAAKLKGLATTDEISVCVKDIDKFRRQCKKLLVSIEPDTEYGNVKVTEIKDDSVWFNTNGNPVQVDDIELYLEMMIDKPRGPKIAETLKEKILEGFRK